MQLSGILFVIAVAALIFDTIIDGINAKRILGQLVHTRYYEPVDWVKFAFRLIIFGITIVLAALVISIFTGMATGVYLTVAVGSVLIGLAGVVVLIATLLEDPKIYVAGIWFGMALFILGFGLCVDMFGRIFQIPWIRTAFVAAIIIYVVALVVYMFVEKYIYEHKH